MSATAGSKPPLAKAAREFLRGMKLPKIGRMPDENFKVCGLVSVMLLFASGLREDADCAVCSPSQSQLAELMHCSRPTIERMIRKLRESGVVSKLNRGRTSCLYTIHKTPQQVMDQAKQADLSTQLPRPINSNPSTHQQEPFAPSTVDTHWVSPLEKSSLGYCSLEDTKATSKATAPFLGESQSQKQRPRHRVRNDADLLIFALRLRKSFDGTGLDFLYQAYDAIGDKAKAAGLSYEQACEELREEALRDQREGVVIDAQYFAGMVQRESEGI